MTFSMTAALSAFGAPPQVSPGLSATPWRTLYRAHCPPRPTLSCASSSSNTKACAAARSSDADSNEPMSAVALASGAPAGDAAAGASTASTQTARASKARKVKGGGKAAQGVSKIPIDTAAFLSQHWGVKPLFLPRLLPDFESPISPDDLAGLACEEDVESRIITGRGCGREGSVDEEPYTLTLGPFGEDVFSSPLCADGKPWTLLVQEVNRHIPEVADVLDRFRFLPNWRVDDVMVSYATTGGGVGPHVDNYDVFLLQVAGKRRWRTSSKTISAEEEAASLVPNIDIRVLKNGFEADQDHILSPGDCMYVSPRCPHWGESLSDDCVTFSIGFRAPAIADLALGWAEETASTAALGTSFLADISRDLLANSNDPGRISDSAIDAAYMAVLNALADGKSARDRFRDWFCEQVSAPKRFREAVPAGEESITAEEARDVVELVLCGGACGAKMVRQQEGSVFAYTVVDDTARIYVDGEVVVSSCSIRLASLICGRRATPASEYADLTQWSGSTRIDKEEVRSILSGLLTRDLMYVAGNGDESEWD